MKLLVLLIVCSCAYMPHVDPAARARNVQLAAAVTIQSDCTETDPFGGSPIEWAPERTASGVVVSERHVLTAAHAVSCPTIPVVHVRLSDGRVVRMVVTREDREADLAILEVDTLQNLDLGIAPPKVAVPRLEDNQSLCAVSQTRGVCGLYSGAFHGTGLMMAHTGPGWSGAAVYDSGGQVAGIVIAGTRDATQVAFVGPEWLP